jgi:hypothetical protein
MGKAKKITVNPFTQILNRRSTAIILLGLILLIGLPLKIQNINLNAYISDDAWWHFRQVKQVFETGRRLNPDIYEFTTLGRPMTYPPLFHYTVAFAYKLFSKILSLIKFTHYFNILEAFLYILLIFWISYLITSDNISSIIGALSASVSYGMIIRARTGELMPFVLSDLLALAGALLLLIILKDVTAKNSSLLSVTSGILFGLSMLSWAGAAFIYLPLILLAFLAVILSDAKLAKTAIKLFFLSLIPFLVIILPWYLPIVMKFGINPHRPEMDWFMKNFTVLHQVKPLNFYIFTTGLSVFFIPVAFLICIFRRSAVSLFFALWIILAGIATYSGWRGYVAMVPIVAAIAMSVGIAGIFKFFFREGSKYIPAVFIIIFLFTGAAGYYISHLRLKPLDSNDINEVRANARTSRMLEFLKEKFPRAITIDHITWASEDEALGDLRMVGGQYLEYLPEGSSEALKDVSLVYFSNEEAAYKIFQKYNADLIIVRRQSLQMAQLSILLAPPEINPDDYLRIIKDSPDSSGLTINFSPAGTKTILFLMLQKANLKRFELVYEDSEPGNPVPFLVVYKVRKD